MVVSQATEVDKQASQSISSGPYWPQLDGLRTMSLVMIFLIHAWQSPYAHPTWMVMLGFVGVDLFFVLSAFLITSLLIRERAQYGNICYKLFFIRRCLRIWPLYFAALFLGCFILPLLQAQHALPLYPQFLAQQFVPLALFFGNFAIIFNRVPLMEFAHAIKIPVEGLLLPFWTLCVEEQFYFAWPLILRAGKSLDLLALGLCIAEALTIAARAWFQWLSVHSIHVNIPQHLYYCNTLCHLDPLLFGALIAILYHRKPLLFGSNAKSGIAFLTLFFAAFVYLIMEIPSHFLNNSPTIVLDLTINSICCALLLFLLLSWKPIQSVFSHKVLVHLGRLTFAMYVFHNFVLDLLNDVLVRFPFVPANADVFFWMKVALGFPITYGIALVSWKVLEGPCHHLKDRYSRSANAVAPLSVPVSGSVMF